MADGSLSRAPILGDVKNIRGSIGICDIITGGFPCQDISVAGRGAGLAGERSGLFYEVIRLTKEIRPPFVFLENVPAIRTRGLEQVIKEFTEIGYDCRWTCLSAASVGAPHKRERWFLLAHANGQNLWKQSNQFTKRESQIEFRFDGEKELVANANISLGSGLSSRAQSEITKSRGNGQHILDTNSKRLERQRQEPIRAKQKFSHAIDASWWSTEPSVGRVANGTPFRVDRIKAIGNGVVPLQVRTAFELLIGVKNDRQKNNEQNY